MANVHVRQAHSMSRAEARTRLASFEEMLKKYRVGLTWKGDTASISGVGVSGDIKVEDQAVDVTVQLGFLARAAGVDAEKLQQSIARRLKEAYEG